MKFLDGEGLTLLWARIKSSFQEKLVSGTNIKTVNGNSLLGSGDMTIESGGVSGDYLPLSGGTLSGNLTVQGYLDIQGEQKLVMNESSDFIPSINVLTELDVAFDSGNTMQFGEGGITINGGTASDVYTTNGYTMTIEAIDDATINALS